MAILTDRLAALAFDAEDARLLADGGLPATAAEFLAGFCAHLRQVAAPAEDGRAEPIQQEPEVYLVRLAAGDLRHRLDHPSESRQVASAGALPGPYLAAYASYVCSLLAVLEQTGGSAGGCAPASVRALMKLAFFGLGRMLSAGSWGPMPDAGSAGVTSRSPPQLESLGRLVGLAPARPMPSPAGRPGVEDLGQQDCPPAAPQENGDSLLRAQAVAGIGSWRLDIDRDELSWTPQAYRIFGLPEGAPVNYQTFLACVHPDDRDRLAQAWQAALAGADYHLEHRVVAGGGERWVEERAEIYRDYQGRPRQAVGTVQDITDRKRAAQRIEQLAFYDALTGLPNRVSFMERLGQALEAADASAQRLALLYLDLDRFKEINDAEGHGAGDRVLIEVARRLLATVGGRATVARLSSDEFGVLVPQRDEAAIRRMIAAIHGSLAMKSRHYAHAVPASMGIAFYPDDAGDAQQLLIHAEIAMHQAKARGTKHYFYKKQLGEAQRRRYALARALEHALVSDQLTLHYQPQVAAHDGRLAGVEALARWRDPQHGWISPAEFIPVAESYGLIGELGRMALHEAAAQVAAWRAAGTPLPGRVAVNVSARQLEDAGFYEDTLAIVRDAGATPADIELELTETALMRDPQHAAELTRALVGAGFAIAVDDFGTGYSSLVQLKRLAVGKLKIDMSLVRDMLTDKSDCAIVEAIVAMGRSLGVVTVAEGVESAAHARALGAIGCSYFQGYHFDRPLGAVELHAKWLLPAGR